MIKQEGNALQDCGSLPATGDPLNNEQVAVNVPNDVVLFLLDGGHDVAHVFVILLTERLLQ